MLFFALFSFISSFEIPHQRIDKPHIILLKNDERILEFAEKHEFFVCLRTSIYNQQFLHPYMEAQALFDPIYPFVVVYEEHLPILEFYNHSQKIASFSPVLDEITLLTCLDTMLSSSSGIAKTKEELSISFGNTALTIIGTFEDKQLLLNFSISTPKEKGICSIAFATKEVLKEIGFKENEIGVYHRIDNNINVFDKNDSIDAFFKAIKPQFDFISANELKNHDKDRLIFALLRNSINSNHSNFLFDMSTKYPQIDFSVLNKDSLAYVFQFTHCSAPYTHDANAVVLNISGGYFYNINDYLSEEMKVNYFDTQKWEEKTIWFLDSILNNSINKTYKSEYEPRYSRAHFASKIVGTNYNKFFEDINETDILMYYVLDNQECRKLFDQFMLFGRHLIENIKYNGTKLGFIDIGNNMVEGGFPVTPEETPAIILFKGEEKKEIRMNGKTFTARSLAEFVHENGSGEFDLTKTIDFIEGRLPKKEETVDISDL